MIKERMQSVFPICRWDSIIDGCSANPKPVIYFTPTFEVLKFMFENKWRIKIMISGSCSIYDDHIICGTVNQSDTAGGCRPVFFYETGLYTVSLDEYWNGYPAEMGAFSIVGFSG